jgi:hypothetical protein
VNHDVVGPGGKRDDAVRHASMTGGAIPLRRGLAALSVVAALPAVAPAASLYEHGTLRKAKTVPVHGSGGRQAKKHWARAMGSIG